jgi:hypothetical protein
MKPGVGGSPSFLPKLLLLLLLLLVVVVVFLIAHESGGAYMYNRSALDAA